MVGEEKRNSRQAKNPESSKAPEVKPDKRSETGDRIFYKTTAGNALLNDMNAMIDETLRRTKQEAEEDRKLARREAEEARRTDAEKTTSIQPASHSRCKT
jgi:hypothetical protein